MDVACFLMILLLIAFVPMSARVSSLLTLRILNLFDLTSSCNQKCATSVCFILPIPCRWRMCSVAGASMISTRFTANPESHIMLWTPFASDAPNAAAYNSASALLLATICRFLVYAFKHECDHHARRLPRFLCLQPSLSVRRPSLQVPNEPLQFGETVL